MPMPKGSKHSEETKAKMRAAHLGCKHTDEAKAKIREALAQPPEPCPFCGSADLEVSDRFSEDANWCVFCLCCHSSSGYYSDATTAIAQWSKRAALAQPPGGWTPVADCDVCDGLAIMGGVLMQATSDTDGESNWEELWLPAGYRLCVYESKQPQANPTAYGTGDVIARDWDTPEEDAAWEHLEDAPPQAGTMPVEVQPPQHVREYIEMVLEGEYSPDELCFVLYNDTQAHDWLQPPAGAGEPT